MATHTSQVVKLMPRLIDFAGVFTFDLSIGQKCEYIYPEGKLCSEDLKAVAMQSFPDSQSLSAPANVDCCYAFSFLSSSLCDSSGSREYQCYVYFRQVENSSSARGYYQKSLVLFSSSSSTFANWQAMFGLLRHVGTQFHAVDTSDLQKQVLVDAYENTASPAFFPTDDLFVRLLPGLWHVWEALLVGIPVLVYAPGDAELCTHSVLSLVSLIAPIEYGGTVIPVLSMFDPKYTALPQNNLLVGVTNPLAFSQLSSRFSIIVGLGEKISIESSFIPIGTTPEFGGVYVSDSISSVTSGTRRNSLSARLSASSVEYRLVLPADMTTLGRRLVSGFNGDMNKLNANVIRKYFSSLTRDFLVPFLPYVHADESAVAMDPIATSTARVLAFDLLDFLRSRKLCPVGHFGLLTPLKAECLYTHIVTRSVSFAAWLVASQKEANRQALIHHCEQIRPPCPVWTSPLDKEQIALRIVQLQHGLVEFGVEGWHEQLNAILDLCMQN